MTSSFPLVRNLEIFNLGLQVRVCDQRLLMCFSMVDNLTQRGTCEATWCETSGGSDTYVKTVSGTVQNLHSLT